MQRYKFHRSFTDIFNDQHVSLVYDQERYLSFIRNNFSLDAFEDQIELKSNQFEKTKRETLVTALKEQYRETDIDDCVQKNIDALINDKTFTITTGHQLSLFTGPLYFVVKILHVIRLCEKLNEQYPENHFVPVYWMATEDHDFEEINHCNIFNKVIKWDIDAKGPVGRLDAQLDEVRDELHDLFQRNPESEIHQLIDKYQGQNYAQAMRNLVNELFGEHGLVIIDGDHVDLKQSFNNITKKELTEHFSYSAVVSTSKRLNQQGVPPQVNPRKINLFYIDKGIRSRIEATETGYSIEGVGEFNEVDLLKMVDEHPERFSPNVVLRPVYQEFILPNLAYIGGVGEISYWLQLKDVFEAVDLLYPLIQIRNSVLWVEQAVTNKRERLDIQLEDVFKDADHLKKNYVQSNESDSLDFEELDSLHSKLAKVLDQLVNDVDPGMNKYAQAEIARLDKQISTIKEKMIRAYKKRHEDAMKGIDFIKDRLFPDGQLQERKVNFFQFCPDGDYRNKLGMLYRSIDPIEKDLIVIRE